MWFCNMLLFLTNLYLLIECLKAMLASFVLIHCMVQEGMSVHGAAGCCCKCMLMLRELPLTAVLAVSIA